MIGVSNDSHACTCSDSVEQDSQFDRPKILRFVDQEVVVYENFFIVFGFAQATVLEFNEPQKQGQVLKSYLRTDVAIGVYLLQGALELDHLVYIGLATIRKMSHQKRFVF